MRLGDLDALKDTVVNNFDNLQAYFPRQFIEEIDNAPTIDLKDIYQEGHYDGHIEGYTKAINEEKPQGEWIPVSERLPNRNGVYNVTRKLKEGETIYFISDASYFDGQNTWHDDTGINHGRPYLNDIIAWQPLPEPYMKGGAE